MDLTGKLLIAMPGMGDPRFDRSVVYLCSHGDDGAMGLIVNKPAKDVALADLLERGSGPRLIGGTTEDLQKAVEAGTFHPDLYYRLDVMRVRIPSIAERPEDIAVMFRQYVAQASEQSGLTAPEITPDVIAGLMARDWPGNARALMSEAMRFVLGVGAADDQATADLGLAEQMAQVERSLLAAALRRHKGQATAAAASLKLPRKTFYDKLAKYGLRAEDFR